MFFFNQWLYNSGHPDLKIAWTYDADKKAVNISITQKQGNLFVFSLQYAIDGKDYTIDVKNRETNFSIPASAKPTSVIMDPNVNLLASFEVVAQ